MLVKKTQFGKICSHSITFVTPYFSWKNYVTPRFFMTPYSEENDGPVKLVPYKDHGWVWILGIGYFLPACRAAIIYTGTVTNTRHRKHNNQSFIRKMYSEMLKMKYMSVGLQFDVLWCKICNFILVINVFIHTGKITKFMNLYKEQRYKLTYFYITEVQQQWFYFFLKWAHVYPPSLYEPEMIKPLTKRVMIFQK